ncbi:hypothetical protein ABZX77_05645 [Streptomyces sp. NPDC004237]|uniref:hypothetical protein n=1 Tax=Streptomyces sp. NPDC004237 TaxID=3154455 RepID=UPI0033B0B909
MGAPATPPPPAEATLIRLAREAAGLSAEKAAARAEISLSGSRWRQIEKGYRADMGSEVVAPHTTLAHMAWVVGVTSDRLAETGRTEAADILREMERFRATPPAPEAAPLVELEEWQQRVILGALDERPRSAQEKALLLRKLAEEIEASPPDPENGSTAPHSNTPDQGVS